MSISRVEIQGQVARAQDFTTIKHNEDNKGIVGQMNIQKQMTQEVDNKVRQVHQGEDVEQHQKKFDAKEKGNGQYDGDGGKKRKKSDKKEDGKVVLKGAPNFDMKI